MSRTSREAKARGRTTRDQRPGDDGQAFDNLGIGRLTWIGLTLSAIGWALLLGEVAVTDLVVAKIPRNVPPSFHADLVDIAKSIIASGFGLAIVGSLQTGFGALNRFFEAVLMRSNSRAAPQGRAEPTVDPIKPATTVDKRPYRLLADGSVEVETILGTRRFATMAEARDFI